jgi:hypothetical protein
MILTKAQILMVPISSPDCQRSCFHAYFGYEFTHIWGIEADPARISGVGPTHILGRCSLHVIAMLMVSDYPCSAL